MRELLLTVLYYYVTKSKKRDLVKDILERTGENLDKKLKVTDFLVTIQTDIDSCGLVVTIKYKKDEQASSAARMNYFFFLFLAVSFKFETLFKYFKVILL